MAGDSPSQLLYNLVCLPSSPPAALVRVGAGPLWGASDPRHLTSLFLIQPVSKGTLFFFFLFRLRAGESETIPFQKTSSRTRFCDTNTVRVS